MKYIKTFDQFLLENNNIFIDEKDYEKGVLYKYKELEVRKRKNKNEYGIFKNDQYVGSTPDLESAKGLVDFMKKMLDSSKNEQFVDEQDLDYFLYERKFTKQQRLELADKGFALPDGSFPIVNVDDLKNAIHAHGRAKDIKAAKKHIIKRAKELKREDLIPATW